MNAEAVPRLGIHSSMKHARLALTVEACLARHYGELADRMRPFDLGIARLLEAMAQERERQGRQVQYLALAMFGALRLLHQARTQRIRHPDARNFFVLTSQDASALVKRAARLEGRASRFYNRCATLEHYSPLRHLYWELSEGGKQRAEVLLEAMEGVGDRLEGFALSAA